LLWLLLLLLLDPTAFGKLNPKRNGASGQNVRRSTHQDRLDIRGVGVERENSVHKIETLYSTDCKNKRHSFKYRLIYLSDFGRKAVQIWLYLFVREVHLPVGSYHLFFGERFTRMFQTRPSQKVVLNQRGDVK
jgi:hypothetical protein